MTIISKIIKLIAEKLSIFSTKICPHKNTVSMKYMHGECVHCDDCGKVEYK